MLYEESFKNNDFCQVIRNILYMDEEKKLITYFSHSELHTIGTTELKTKMLHFYLLKVRRPIRVFLYDLPKGGIYVFVQEK